MIIEKGKSKDIEEIVEKYNKVNEYLAKREESIGWEKGIYPSRETAKEGVEKGELYVAKENDIIIASFIINNRYDSAYEKVKWEEELKESEIMILHTLVVHPEHHKKGVGKRILEFIEKEGKIKNIKSIRLDTYEKNTPGIILYEKMGYKFKGKINLDVDLGLDKPAFNVYEILL